MDDNQQGFAPYRNGDLVRILKEIYADGESGAIAQNINQQFGVCGVLADRLSLARFNTYTWVEDHVTTWAHFSGDMGYPVPSNQPGVTPKMYYDNNRDGLWQGEQLALRLSLIQHLIAACEAKDQQALATLSEPTILRLSLHNLYCDALLGSYINEQKGICALLYAEVQKHGSVKNPTDWVCNTAKSWPNHSKSWAFPVPKTNGNNFIYLSRHRKLWVGEQLELRLSLLEHLIAAAKSL